MSPTNYSRYKYTPDEMSQTEFLARFVVRDEEFADIFEDIKRADYSVPTQHYIIIGQRGQGKTTLLRKILIEIEADSELSKLLLPVKFAEEQYQIRSLCRLWEEVADYLQALYAEEFPDILDGMEEHIDDEDYELRCFSYLESKLKAKKRKLVLLIDNIDELLGKLKPKEQRQLREILLTSSSFRIIGGSTKMLEQHFDYGKPFYEFFKLVKLQGLDRKESVRFLLSIGTEEQKVKMQTIVEREPQRIETLRRLTGGVPRTLVMLFDIFIDDGGNAFDDLLKVLDEATPLYKHRMDDLPPMLQDIVHTIAMNWDGMMTKEIAKKTRLESKVVSAQLKQLTDKYQIVEATSIGKNKIYKLQERFFNIWYLMRFGRKKDRQRVEWLVKFLVSWCSPKELEERANKFIGAINRGEVNENYAYVMCEALSYAGLEKDTEHRMKESVKNHLKSMGSYLAGDLSSSDKELIDKVQKLVDEGDIKSAIASLLQSNKSSKTILFGLGWLYHEQKEYEKAEEYYLKAIESGDNIALNNLSVLYSAQAKNINEAVKLAQKYYRSYKNTYSTYTLAIILLWHEDFIESYKTIFEFLEYDSTVEHKDGMILYLNLLIAKEQYHKAKEFLEMPKYQLKERYKAIWYALMELMQDEFPNEIKKMGSELRESVDEVLLVIERLAEKYAIE